MAKYAMIFGIGEGNVFTGVGLSTEERGASRMPPSGCTPSRGCPPLQETDGQQADGAHTTGMHSCISSYHLFWNSPLSKSLMRIST